VSRYTIDKHAMTARGARRRRSVLATSLIAAATVALAGCGSSSSSSSHAAASSTASASPAAASTSTTAASTSTTAASTSGPIVIGAGATVIPGVYDSSAQMDPGFTAALGYINAHGGWGGRTVKVIKCSSPGDPASDTKCIHQFISAHAVATVGLLGANGTIGLPLYSKAGVADFSVSTTALENASPWETSLTTGTIGTFTLPARYACAKGYKTVSVLHDDSAQQKTAQAAFANAIYTKCGITVNQVTVPQGAPDLAPYLTKAVSTHPQLLVALPTVPGATLVSDIAAAGYPMSQTIMTPQASGNFYSTPALAGALIEGGQIPISQNPNPDIQTFLKSMSKYSPGTDPLGQLTLEGYQAIITIWQASKAVGFSKVTGTALKNYMNTKAPGTMTIFAGTPVTTVPGQPGAKEAYMLITRVASGPKVQSLGWWPALSGCTSQADCASGVKQFGAS
jgi:ABC-type branched-subunit amino acid transport system substrate-binding protein